VIRTIAFTFGRKPDKYLLLTESASPRYQRTNGLRGFAKKDAADAAEFVLADGHSVAVSSSVSALDCQLTMIQKSGLIVKEVVAFTTVDLTEAVSPKLNVIPGGQAPVLRGYTVAEN
jgi:hypothetical protein